MRDDILEMVQGEVEKCDRLEGFLSLLSLAGGTGSGVGAFVTEILREEFPYVSSQLATSCCINMSTYVV